MVAAVVVVADADKAGPPVERARYPLRPTANKPREQHLQVDEVAAVADRPRLAVLLIGRAMPRTPHAFS